MRKIYFITFLIITILFSGCGDTSSPENPNHIPVILSDTLNIDNNNSIEPTLYSDLDNDIVNFKIIGGDDQDIFNIDSNTGQLSFKQTIDYLNPIDKDHNNIYLVTIQISDFKSSSTKTLRITFPNTVLTILNSLRKNSGMTTLKTNNYLNIAALNHANYLDNLNQAGHYETNSSTTQTYFTGITPAERTWYAGYKTKYVIENLSTGQQTPTLSLDGLMSAIYHRFGFLDFAIDEIGYGNSNNIYVYDMGNSYLNNLCDGDNFDGSGEYYYNVCKDTNFKIQKSLYDQEKDIIVDQNPPYVIYPYNTQQNVTPVFYNEIPDPLADYNVSGYPVSIEFNQNDFNMSKFSLDTFVLENSNNENIELIPQNDGSTFMDQNNDPNQRFTQYQFAIFPKERLNFNTIYKTKLTYTYDGNSYHKEFSFTTKALPNLINVTTDTIALKLNTQYYLYFKPQNADDTIHTYSISYHYSGTNNVNIIYSYYDKNTIALKLSGSSLEDATITLNNTKNITVNIIK